MNAKTSICPPSDVLADFGLGKLDSSQVETIGAHLETCIECRQVVGNVSSDSFVNRLRAARAPAGGDHTPARLEHERSSDAETHTFVPDESEIKGAKQPVRVAPNLALPSNSNGTEPAAICDIPPELSAHPDYEVLKELGRGGMGVVYLARNRVMDRLEVLKVVSTRLLNRPQVLERFMQEIRAGAQLSHPNIVAAYSVVRTGSLVGLAMEHVQGEDLGRILKRHGPLPVAHAAFYAYQAALGLQHAHERKMVHRDIKPGNLILTVVKKRHVIKILDFGLAKVTNVEPSKGLTETGQILGTPDYMSPEQIRESQGSDIRADIYSLGCTLYCLLAGNPPFCFKGLYELLRAHHTLEPRALHLVRAEVPTELSAVVARMLAKDPGQRQQTPAEVARQLSPFYKPSKRPATATNAKPSPHRVASAKAGLRPSPVVMPLAAPPQEGDPPAGTKTSAWPRAAAMGTAFARHDRRWLSLAGAVLLLGLASIGVWRYTIAPASLGVQSPLARPEPRTLDRLGIIQALESPLKTTWQNAGLRDIANDLRTEYRMNVISDERALERAGVEIKKAKFSWPDSRTSLELGLQMMLHPRSMGCTIRENCLWISSKQALGTIMELAMYRTPPAVVAENALRFTESIEVIDPKTWASVGGVGNVQWSNGVLIIVQTCETLRRIERAFPELQRVETDGVALPVKGNLLKRLTARADVEIDDLPLEAVLKSIDARYRVTIVLDQKELEQRAISPNTPCRLKVDDLPLATALDFLLWPHDLAYYVDGQTIVVTSVFHAETKLSNVSYELASALMVFQDCESLMKCISSFVVPTTWAEVGGVGHQRASIDGKELLIADQSYGVHCEASEFFALLHAAVAKPWTVAPSIRASASF